MEFKCGLTVPSMKVTGSRIKPTAKANFGMPTVTCTRASGKMTRQMDMVSTFMSMGLDTRVIGKMISKMVGELKAGQTALSMKVNTRRA
jgi:hypothetical protein